MYRLYSKRFFRQYKSNRVATANHTHWQKHFCSFRLCRFCVVIQLFHPWHNDQWPSTSKDFYPRYYPLHFCLTLILEKEPVFPFLKLSVKQGNYWYDVYNVFGMTWSLTWDLTRDPRTRCQHSTTRLSRRRLAKT